MLGIADEFACGEAAEDFSTGVPDGVHQSRHCRPEQCLNLLKASGLFFVACQPSSRSRSLGVSAFTTIVADKARQTITSCAGAGGSSSVSMRPA